MQLFQNMGKYSMINNVVYRQSSNKYSGIRGRLNDDSIDKSTDTSMRNSRRKITKTSVEIYKANGSVTS